MPKRVKTVYFQTILEPYISFSTLVELVERAKKEYPTLCDEDIKLDITADYDRDIEIEIELYVKESDEEEFARLRSEAAGGSATAKKELAMHPLFDLSKEYQDLVESAQFTIERGKALLREAEKLLEQSGVK